MPFEISYDENNYFVKLEMFGLDKKEDHHIARDEAFKLCKKHDCTNLLVDLRKLEIRSRSTLGCFEFGESVAETLKGIKIAHVLPKQKLTRNDIKFISNVEHNRGGLCQEFDNFEEAKNWLIK